MKPIEHPVTIVLFGATGDLSQKKIFPSLWDLCKKHILSPEKIRVIGFARDNHSDESFRDMVSAVIRERRENVDTQTLETFVRGFSYEVGAFEKDAGYEQLKRRIREKDESLGQCSTKVVYLAVPPRFYNEIFDQIAKSGILRTCDNAHSGPGRILVEKPFGRNTETAQELDIKLGDLFDESQIFRIDHYLAKETIQNILNFRFANHIFEPLWNKNHIESVHIRLAENFGVEDRGEFYDGIGALRDVGQNHILQMLAMITMESPETFSPASIRTKREEVLNAVVPACDVLGDQYVCDNVLRGQYEGYLEEAGVDPNSQTETYFRIMAQIRSSKWEGVPFILESGKHLKETETSIRINFKPSTLAALCPVDNEFGCSNILTFHIKPFEGISICFWAKHPGFSKELKRHTLHFRYDEEESSAFAVPDAYEHVLVEAIRGDQTLFPSTEEIRAQWEFITPIVEKWKDLPLVKYKKGESGSHIFDKNIKAKKL